MPTGKQNWMSKWKCQENIVSRPHNNAIDQCIEAVKQYEREVIEKALKYQEKEEINDAMFKMRIGNHF